MRRGGDVRGGDVHDILFSSSPLLLFFLHAVQNLPLAAAIAIVADGFAAKLACQMIEFVDGFDCVIGRAVTGLRDRIIDVLLSRGKYFYVFERFNIHRGYEVRRQFRFVFDDVFSGCFYRFFIRLIDRNAECLGCRRVYVCSRAKRVLTDVCP